MHWDDVQGNNCVDQTGNCLSSWSHIIKPNISGDKILCQGNFFIRNFVYILPVISVYSWQTIHSAKIALKQKQDTKLKW